MEAHDFFLDIAYQFITEYGPISNDAEETSMEILNSITPETVDSTFVFYLNAVKSHMENIDFFTCKMNSLNAKIKIPGQQNVADCKLT